MKSLRAAIVLGLAACGPSVLWTGHTPARARRVEVVEDGDEQFVRVDGVRAPGFDAIAAWSLAFSDDGRHVAYAARRGASWHVVHDGRPGPAWDGIGEIVVAPRTARVAYAAERAGGWHVVTAGVVGPRHDAILRGTLRFSPDGSRVVYVAESGTRARVVVDGAPGPLHDGVGQLVVGADNRVAYTARRGSDVTVVVDGAAAPTSWRRIAKLQLGARGRVAYAGFDGHDWRVVVDGAATAAADAVPALAISPDGAHVAWIARVGDVASVVVDEAPIAAAPAIDPATFQFVPGASARLAWVETVAATGGQRLVVGGAAGTTYDAVGAPAWTADGRRVAYAARRGGVWAIVVDGVEHPVGAAASAPVWSPDGRRLGYVGRDATGWFVRVGARRFRYDLVFEDSLAFSRDGRAFCVIAGDLARERLFFALDGTRRVPLAARELYFAVASRGEDALLAESELLRRFCRAEAELRTRN